MKIKLKSIYIQVKGTEDLIKTDIVPNGYNVYIDSFITWKNKRYKVVDRVNEIKSFYLLIVKEVK